MGRTIRWAGRATGSPALATAMTFGMLLFVTALLLAAVGTLAVVGAWLLPETVLLRRIAGAERRPLRDCLGTAVRDSGTLGIAGAERRQVPARTGRECGTRGRAGAGRGTGVGVEVMGGAFCRGCGGGWPRWTE